jgi:hypothetical protein
MDIKGIIYTIMNKPHFEVKITLNNRVIKTFYQLASSTEKGCKYFLIDKSLKSAWWKPFTPIINGCKFEVIAKMDNAIPLLITTETKYYTEDYIIKEVEEITISEDEAKQKEFWHSGMVEKTEAIPFPPSVLYEIVDAQVVGQVLSVPLSKWEALSQVYIYLIIGAVIVFWYMSSNGSLKALGVG